MSMVDDFLGNERTTGKLAMNGKVKGKLQRPHDEDWFAVTLEAGVSYFLAGSNLLGIRGFAIAIFDPLAGGVVAAAGGGEDKEVALEFTPRTTGTYYAMAAELAGNYAITDYTLQIAPRATPDDLAGNAATKGVLAPGTPAAGVFEQRGDVDWFRFRAEQGYHYTFDAQGPDGSGIASSLRVLDALGRLVETPGTGFNPLASGDYYIALTGAREGAYSVSAKAVRDDFAEHQATTGRLPAGSQVQGSIDYELDRDWFQVDFKAGEFYTFSLQSEQDFVFGMNLVDKDGVSLARVSGFQYGHPLSLTYQATASVTAFVEVDRGLTSRMIEDATPYRLALASTADDIGQDAAGARALAVDATAQGSLQAGSDRDAFRLSLTAGVSYRFDLAAGAGGDYLKLELAGAESPQVLASHRTGSQGSLGFTPLASGDYLVTVASEGGVPANLAYALTAVRTADDWAAHAAGAGQLGLGAGVSGTLEHAADRDWFALRADGGATYWIDAKWVDGGDAGGTGSGAALRILDAVGREIKNYIVPYHHTPLVFKPEAGGTYFIEMGSAHGHAGGYTLSAAIGAPDDTGDSSASARTLPTGGSIDARLEAGSDIDVFRLDAVAGQTYELQVSTPAFTSVHSTLTDASGNAVTDAIHDDASQKVFLAKTTGPFYLSVSGFAPGNYQVRAQAYRDDHPNSIAAGVQALAIGGSVAGKLEYRSDSDVFSIQLDAHRTQVLKIAAATPGTLPPMFDSVFAGPTIGRVEQSVQNGERIVSLTADKPGTYYVYVAAGAGAYTITSLPFAGDGVGPTLVAQSLADGAAGVPLTERTLSLRFSESIVIDRSAIVIRDSAGNVVPQSFGRELYPVLKDDTLVLKTLNYLTPDTYTVSLPANAIHDKDGNRYAGPETIRFSTVQSRETADPGDGVYVASKTGAVVDGGAGTDTFVVESASMFTFVLPDGGDLVVWNMLAGTYDRIRNFERLQFPDQVFALDIEGVAGQAYRLYQAAFNRTPDHGGLGFWIGQMDRGTTLQAVAQGFVDSAEFAALYGNAPSDTAFLQAVYRNVLHREFDAGGLAWWLDAMQDGMPRHHVLAHFSESAENKEALADIIGGGFPYLYIPML